MKKCLLFCVFVYSAGGWGNPLSLRCLQSYSQVDERFATGGSTARASALEARKQQVLESLRAAGHDFVEIDFETGELPPGDHFNRYIAVRGRTRDGEWRELGQTDIRDVSGMTLEPYFRVDDGYRSHSINHLMVQHLIDTHPQLRRFSTDLIGTNEMVFLENSLNPLATNPPSTRALANQLYAQYSALRSPADRSAFRDRVVDAIRNTPLGRTMEQAGFSRLRNIGIQFRENDISVHVEFERQTADAPSRTSPGVTFHDYRGPRLITTRVR